MDEGLHAHAIQICLDACATSVRITVPAILGVPRLVEIIEAWYESAKNCVLPGTNRGSASSVQAIADELPEHVLCPKNH